MTQQEIEARALELYPERKRQNKNGTGEYDANLPRRKAYIKGRTDAQPTDEERQQVIDIIRRGMQNRIAAIVNPEMARELSITPAEAELLKKYAVEIPHVEILPPDFNELKNIQMDGSALKINIQFKIKPQNPKEL